MSLFLGKFDKSDKSDMSYKSTKLSGMDGNHYKEDTSMNELYREVPAESGVTAEEPEEHYDGSRMSDVYENYDSFRWDRDGCHFPVHFLETRKYLQQVRDLKRHVKLVEDRIGYREDAGLDTDYQREELESLRQELKQTLAEVADEIGKLEDINQQVIMTKRYIDLMSWDEIAETADFKMRTVQKCHGHALPNMEKILLEDGLIVLEDDDNDNDDEME